MHHEGYNAILDVLTTLTMKVRVLGGVAPFNLAEFWMKVLS